MLELLSRKEKDVLLSYDFVIKYLNDQIGQNEFFGYLSDNKQDLLKKGVNIEFLLTEESLRKRGHGRFTSFMKRLGLEFATPQQIVNWIKSMDCNQFLNILSVSNSFLRGIFKLAKWEGKVKSVVTAQGDIMYLEPPENVDNLFRNFFNQMKSSLNEHNLNLWAAKMYVAIVFTHMFADGNGRLARNAYYVMRTGGVLDESKSSNRSGSIAEIAMRINQQAGLSLFAREGIHLKNFIDAANYRATKEESYWSEVESLRYLAAKRILQRRKEWIGNETLILYGNWSKDKQDQLFAEYQKVLEEWYLETLNVASQYGEWLIGSLDKALN